MTDTDATTQDRPRDDQDETPTEDAGKLMEFGDAVEVATGKDHLWSVISDPETLTECVPGADEIARVSKREYTLDISRGVSHLTLAISGDVEFVEMNEPDWIVADGNARDAKTGSEFDVLAAMELEELAADRTRLTYTAEVSMTGGAATLGPKLLRPIVNRDVTQYFENVKGAVEADRND
jgi:carbon monoxide dehydrogenase subunit G